MRASATETPHRRNVEKSLYDLPILPQKSAGDFSANLRGRFAAIAPANLPENIH
jgi:hypothetical protein